MTYDPCTECPDEDCHGNDPECNTYAEWAAKENPSDKEYEVILRMTVTATTHEEAARDAQETIDQADDSWSFEVKEVGTDEVIIVDLADHDDDDDDAHDDLWGDPDDEPSTFPSSEPRVSEDDEDREFQNQCNDNRSVFSHP